jgi:hypothetical protein
MGRHSKQPPRKNLRNLDAARRRARLLAARERPVGGLNRRAILNGEWDGGSLVRRHLVEVDDANPR